MRASTLLLPLLAACAGEDSDVVEYILPVAGQTAVDSDAELLVRGGAREIPPGYDLGDAIRVVDLDTGGLVPGVTEVQDGDLWFLADEPWAEGKRYAWTVGGGDPVPHGPELPIPEHLVGTAAFGTDPDAVDLLAAGWDDDGPWDADGNTRACVVLSRPAGDLLRDAELRVTINDVELEDAAFSVHDVDAWAPFEIYSQPDPDWLGDEPPVDVMCLDTAAEVDAGAAIRVWWGDHGPWRLEIEDRPMSEIVRDLHRGTP